MALHLIPLKNLPIVIALGLGAMETIIWGPSTLITAFTLLACVFPLILNFFYIPVDLLIYSESVWQSDSLKTPRNVESFKVWSRLLLLYSLTVSFISALLMSTIASLAGIFFSSYFIVFEAATGLLGFAETLVYFIQVNSYYTTYLWVGGYPIYTLKSLHVTIGLWAASNR